MAHFPEQRVGPAHSRLKARTGGPPAAWLPHPTAQPSQAQPNPDLQGRLPSPPHPPHLLGAPHARDDLVHGQLVGGHAARGVAEAREGLQRPQRLIRLLLPRGGGGQWQAVRLTPGRALEKASASAGRIMAPLRKGQERCRAAGGVFAGLPCRRYRRYPPPSQAALPQTQRSGRSPASTRGAARSRCP